MTFTIGKDGIIASNMQRSTEGGSAPTRRVTKTVIRAARVKAILAMLDEREGYAELAETDLANFRDIL